MWVYEKKLMYPVKLKKANPRLAKIIMEQYGGPDGELGASIRYLSQRFNMATPQAKAILNDVGISSPEMLHFAQMADKPCGNGLLIHTITSN